MARTWNEFVEQLKGRVRACKLVPEDFERCLRQAIQQRYSKDAPRKIVADVAGNGSNLLPVPAGWEDGTSQVLELEYPIGSIPPETIDDKSWQMYDAPSGTKIAVISQTIGAGESVRVRFTARHAGNGSTVPDADFEAVCDYAASLAFEVQAAMFVQTGDSSLQADAVNYRTKSQECLGLAKQFRKNYFEHVGVEEGSGAGSSTAAPALAMGDFDAVMEPGIGRITHGGRR